MPTNFPSALDTFPSAVALASHSLQSDPHSALHGNLGDALAALEAKVGVDGSSVPSSLDYLLSLKAALASPTFTGAPSGPTPSLADSSTRFATTAYVQGQGYLTSVPPAPVSSVFGRVGAVVSASGDYSVSQVTGAAPLASPGFTGVPTAPTAALGTNTTQLATTAFVLANAGGSGVTSFNTRTGTVTLTTADVTGALGFSDFARTGQSNTFSGNQGFGAAPQATFWIHVGAGQNLAVRSISGALQIAAADDTFFDYVPGYFDARPLYLNRYSAGPVLINGNVDLGGPVTIHLLANVNIGFRLLGGAGQFFVLDDLANNYIPFLFDGSPLVLNRYSGAGVGIGTDSPASLLDLFGGTLTASANSSTSIKRTQAEWLPSWVDSTDATRKARVLLRAWDTAAREGLRIEADGANPLIGFLGANAVSRPTVTGSRGGNAALASLLSALASLGLITDSTT